jgi:hypothetical protein
MEKQSLENRACLLDNLGDISLEGKSFVNNLIRTPTWHCRELASVIQPRLAVSFPSESSGAIRVTDSSSETVKIPAASNDTGDIPLYHDFPDLSGALDLPLLFFRQELALRSANSGVSIRSR